eukprot:3295209-Rhodomonas_salina.1
MNSKKSSVLLLSASTCHPRPQRELSAQGVRSTPHLSSSASLPHHGIMAIRPHKDTVTHCKTRCVPDAPICLHACRASCTTRSTTATALGLHQTPTSHPHHDRTWRKPRRERDGERKTWR